MKKATTTNVNTPQDWDACFEAYKADMSSIIRTGLKRSDVNDILSSLLKK